MPGPERRLAAILFSDIVGYTALMAKDEAGGLRARERHRSLLGAEATRYHGEVVDESGDELVLCFPSAVEAVNCALAVQAELADDSELQLRIGIHTGDVIFQEGRVYGDGVNVASRVRPHAEPGGVCVSEAVYDSVENQPNVEATSLGEQEFKNVARPVEVFALRGTAAEPGVMAAHSGRSRLRLVLASGGAAILVLVLALWATWPRPLGLLIDLTGAGAPPVNPPLPDKPSVVVLPFENMSGDPDQEYFSDGMTQDLITDLSRSPSLFVIARNSAFTYKGRAVNVGDVGRELGVRYVVEGSVRRGSDRIRVTAQLIEAASGFHIWSERYDRALADLFSVQSELAEQIMGAVVSEILVAEIERIRRRSTESLTAHDLVMRALHDYDQFTRKAHERARALLESAIELDPEYATAHALLSGIDVNAFSNLWSLDPTLLDRALEQAERAVELDPNWDVSHTILAFAQMQSGDPLGSLRSTSRALRRNPKLPSVDLQAIAMINYRAGRTEVAQELFERIRATNPDLIAPRLQLVAMYDSQGRDDEAQTLGREILRVNPELTADLVVTHGAVAIMFDADERAELRDQLRRAGLP